MRKKINLFAEITYNFLIGFWTIFSYLLSIAFIIDDDGVGIFMLLVTIIVYLFLLIPNNYIFLKNNSKIEKIFIIVSFIVGILFAIFFHRGQGIINTLGILHLILLNIIFLTFNKKSELIYIILLLILDITFIYYTLIYFNII